jgi:hypothetical protein
VNHEENRGATGTVATTEETRKKEIGWHSSGNHKTKSVWRRLNLKRKKELGTCAEGTEDGRHTPWCGNGDPEREPKTGAGIDEEKSNPWRRAQIEQESTRQTETKLKSLNQETHHR